MSELETIVFRGTRSIIVKRCRPAITVRDGDGDGDAVLHDKHIHTIHTSVLLKFSSLTSLHAGLGSHTTLPHACTLNYNPNTQEGRDGGGDGKTKGKVYFTPFPRVFMCVHYNFHI